VRDAYRGRPKPRPFAATGRWILVLDADETLHPAGIQVIRDLVSQQDEDAGYYFERLNYEAGSAAPRKDYVVRLFPNRRYDCPARGACS
jgi:hypothetical protein